MIISFDLVALIIALSVYYLAGVAVLIILNTASALRLRRDLKALWSRLFRQGPLWWLCMLAWPVFFIGSLPSFYRQLVKGEG